MTTLNKIVPISSINTDFYAWGKNCRLLKYNKENTAKIIEDYRLYYLNISAIDYDLFWEGYYYGCEGEK